MNSLRKSVALILVLLAIAMIYIGGFYGDKVILPPIITGIGFLAIALVFAKEKS